MTAPPEIGSWPTILKPVIRDLSPTVASKLRLKIFGIPSKRDGSPTKMIEDRFCSATTLRERRKHSLRRKRISSASGVANRQPAITGTLVQSGRPGGYNDGFPIEASFSRLSANMPRLAHERLPAPQGLRLPHYQQIGVGE
jgi:hypothetical protein